MLDQDVPVGGSIVLYLEQGFQVPESIPMSSVYLVAEGGSSNQMRTTGSGARVYASIPVILKTDAYFGPDTKDIAIRVLVPDMCTNATAECEGPNGLHMGQTVTMVIQKSAGIKNPSEAGKHRVGISVLGPTASIGDPMYKGDMVGTRAGNGELETFAKISLSDVDNKRGYELTVAGSGFNNGATAAVYVLHDPTVTSDMLTGQAEAILCRRIISDGALVGHSVVGRDGRVAVIFEVTVPPFRPGRANYICMVDGASLMSDTDVEDFRLEPTIRVTPSAASVGDTVTVLAQDFPNPGAAFIRATMAGRTVAGATGTSVSADGSATATFTVPAGLVGVVRLDVEWGGISEDTKLRIIP